MNLEPTVLFKQTSSYVWNPFCLRQLLNLAHPHCSAYMSFFQNILITQVSYLINTRNHYRKDLLYAMVNSLNRLVSFPLQLALHDSPPYRYNLVFVLNYFLAEEDCHLIRQRVHCEDWEKRIVLNIVEMTDCIVKKMMELMGEFEIKHSLYPKVETLEGFVEKLPNLDISMIILNNGNTCEKCAIDMTACSLAERY